jgi:hypothetical protein
MTTDNLCFYLQNRLIQTSQTGGQQYSDSSPFSIPWEIDRKKYTDVIFETRGPALAEPRSGHACGLLKTEAEHYIVVAGGSTGYQRIITD